MFPLENTDYSAADAQLWFATRTSGVYTNGHFPVTTVGGMEISVGKGIAWLHYGEFAGVVYGNTMEVTLKVAISDAIYPRIDRVVIRYDAVQNKGFLTISPGVPASDPVAPELTRNENAYEISLAQIRVGTGVTEITSANITDERLNESVCGLMRDGVTGIDTSVIQAQCESILTKLSTNVNATITRVEQESAQRLSNLETDARTLIGLLEEAYEDALSGKTSVGVTIAIPSSAWVGEEAPYTATVACRIATASNILFVGAAGNASTAEQREAIRNAMIMATGQGDGTITLTADGEKPEMEISINVVEVV